jgi:hypothetical protein
MAVTLFEFGVDFVRQLGEVTLRCSLETLKPNIEIESDVRPRPFPLVLLSHDDCNVCDLFSRQIIVKCSTEQ